MKNVLYKVEVPSKVATELEGKVPENMTQIITDGFVSALNWECPYNEATLSSEASAVMWQRGRDFREKGLSLSEALTIGDLG